MQICLVIRAVPGKCSPCLRPFPGQLPFYSGAFPSSSFSVWFSAQGRGEAKVPHERGNHPTTPFLGPTQFTPRSRAVTLPLWASGLPLVSGHIFTGQWNSPHLHRCVRTSLVAQGIRGAPPSLCRVPHKGQEGFQTVQGKGAGSPSEGERN